jgi:hypothetical protein
MITICEDRYGRGWVAWRCDPEDIDPGFNGGDSEHFAFYRAEHRHPIGWGLTPNDALAALDRETALYQQDTDGYRCRLEDQERGHAPAPATVQAGEIVIDFVELGKVAAADEWARQVLTAEDAPEVPWLVSRKP